jgi:hypothetical protein
VNLETISSPFITLSYALDAGPRLVRLARIGRDENLLGEAPDQCWQTVNGEYRTIGGHRLWHAPQVNGRTDVPDDRPISVERFQDGVQLLQDVEIPTGIRKTMRVQLFTDRAALEITHTLTNCGVWAVELAPWAITQFPLGGVAEVPLPVCEAGPDTNWPTRPLLFWPYARLDEPRLHLEAGRILLDGHPAMPIFKVGCFCREGWVRYTRAGVSLTRRFTPQPALPHTDQGCNVEMFVSDQTIEVEILGPLARLEPGQSCQHTEVWEIAS